MTDLNDLKSIALIGMTAALSINANVLADTIHPAPESNYFAKGCCRWDDRKGSVKNHAEEIKSPVDFSNKKC